MNDRILFPVRTLRGGQYRAELGEMLINAGYDVRYLPYNEDSEKLLLDLVNRERVISGLYSFKPDNNFGELLNRYDIKSADRFVFPQRVYDYSYDTPTYRSFLFGDSTEESREEYMQELHRCLDFVDRLYSKGLGGIPIQNEGAGILVEVLARVAEQHNQPTVWRGFSPVSGHHRLYSNRPPKLDALTQSDFDSLTEIERDEASRYLRRLKSGGQKLSTQNHDKNILKPITDEYFNFKNSSNRTQYLHNVIRGAIIKRAVSVVSKKSVMGVNDSQEYVENNNIVFYPIQYFRESRITYRAPAFYDQAWIIEYISRSLPSHYELVVKDHPEQLGALPVEALRKIKRYATVLHPDTSSHRVIKNSEVVVVLNNTVGIESLLYGKPVVCLGDAIYSGMGYTIDNENINLLHRDLSTAASSDGLSKTEQIEVAHAIISESERGVWADSDREELSYVKNSIINYIQNV